MGWMEAVLELVLCWLIVKLRDWFSALCCRGVPDLEEGQMLPSLKGGGSWTV